MRRTEVEDGTAVLLPRLPPGRHGLSRQFVSRNQRDRIMAGVIAAVAEKGYAGATISEVSAAAGLSRRTIYQHFGGKRDCFLAAYDLIARHLAQTAVSALAAEDLPTRVRFGIEAVLEAFGANPDLALLLAAALETDDPEVRARHRVVTAAAANALMGGVPDGRRSPSVEEAIAAGLASVVVERAGRGEGARLPDLTPELTQLCLSALGVLPAEVMKHG